MKQIMYNIMVCCVAVLFFTACDTNNDIAGGNAMGDGNSIILDLSSSSLPMGRAVATGAEVKVDHIDVLIFGEDGSKKYYERVGGSETGSGTITLKAKRNSFDADTKYWVYLIANSTAEESVFAADDFDRTKLMSLTQEDRNIHLTGYPGTGVDAPECFLMDGIAYPENETEPAVTVTAPVVLYDGNDSNDTKLKAILRRAAAKIVVRINKGQFVEFNNASGTVAGYYLRNMPYSTSVVAGVNAEANLMTSELTDNDYFKWTQDTENGPYTLITVTAYTYAHSWENESALEKETRLIVDIPMIYTPHDADGNSTGEPVEYSNSYYQIPVCQGKTLERNTCYEVSLTLNVPGGTDPLKPVKLEQINYEVREWDEKTIDIGGDQNRPTYLTVNESEMEMRNIPEDYTTLQFTSSSEVEVKIDSVYYYDKFGNKQTLDAQQQAAVNISAEPDPGLTGKIDIKSDVPTNNAIRYIKLKITNADNVTPRTVTIAQYPLEYITFVVGKHSYRSDFGANGEDGNPTTYERLNGQYESPYTTTTRINERRVACYYIDNSWVYENRRNEYAITTGNWQNPFFTSKMSEESNGVYIIYYFHWDENLQGYDYEYEASHNDKSTQESTGEAPENNPNRWAYYGDKTYSTNPRMYYVQITASSEEYTLGKPRIDREGYADKGVDNAVLVSPSFMIASQLGASGTATNITMAKEHCKYYVEVAEDGTVYDDWRLPTRAEIGIINKFQYQSDAIDEILSAMSYWCADEQLVTILTRWRN